MAWLDIINAPCPVEGCNVRLKTPHSIYTHLRLTHGMSLKEVKLIVDPYITHGDDLEKFKADFAKLEAGTL